MVYIFKQDNKRFTLFKSFPTSSELRALGDQGLKADVIQIDFKGDKKLLRLMQLIKTLVKSMESKPKQVIKKIARLVRI